MLHSIDVGMTGDRSVSVGDGATLSVGSDNYPYTIIAIYADDETGVIGQVVLQRDHEILVSGGHTEYQVYRYERDPGGHIVVATARKDGSFREVGTSSSRYYLGRRRYYQDPSF